MGRLTTHVLDTANGRPAAAVRVRVYRIGGGEQRQLLREATTNADGRCDAPLLEDADFEVGIYELVFAAGAYFAAIGSGGPACARREQDARAAWSTWCGQNLVIL